MLHLLLAAAAAASPSPASSPAALKTIVQERVYPVCATLRSNVTHAIAGLLANDQAIDASKPLILDMAKGFRSMSPVAQTGIGNLYHPAQANLDSAEVGLDTNRLERIIGTLTHNIDLMQKELGDPARFPADPKTSSERQNVRIKGMLERVIAQQQKLVNVYNGLLDTQQSGTLASRGDPMDQLFGVDTPEIRAHGNLTPLKPGPATVTFKSDKTTGTNTVFSRGLLTPTEDELDDPQLSQSDTAMLAHNVFGRLYGAVYWQQGRIRYLESPLALRIIETTKECRSSK